MNKLQKGIAVVGSTTIDTIIDGDRRLLKMGGVTTYAGITYRRHGIPTHIVSNLAARDWKIVEKLAAEKLDVVWEASAQTTHFVNYINRQGRHQEVLQTAGPIEYGQIQKIINNVDGLHLGPLHPLDIAISALEALLNSNRSIFLDIQGYTREVKNQKVYRSISDRLTLGLTVAHTIKANRSEYQSMLNHFQMNLTELMIKFKIHETVVTLGDKGGFVQSQSGELVNYAAEKADSLTDPTGTGDVFFAAYIVSRFSDQMQIHDACRYAARIAAEQVKGNYTTNDQLILEES